MESKLIGIAGGMGPKATSDLFSRIIERTPANCDQEHYEIMVYNNPKIPDRSNAILNGGKNPKNEIVNTCQRLEQSGSDFIIIPCNTAHYYFDEIQSEIKIPIINMIKITAEYLNKQNFNKVGVMGTKATLKSRLYQKELEMFNIDAYIPDNIDYIMEMIYDIKKGENPRDLSNKKLVRTLNNLIEKQVEAIVLGCTELSYFFKEVGTMNIQVPLIDPIDLLIDYLK